MKEKKARVEDAMHATRAAAQEGVPPGGGVALLRASEGVGMLGMVLVLGGVVAGDGGQRREAAAEPVAVSVDGEWEGEWDVGTGKPYQVEMRGRLLRFVGEDDVYHVTGRCGQPGGGGTVTIKFRYGGADWTGRGIYKLESGRLRICVTFFPHEPRPAVFRVTPKTILITLKPAARKP
jgi:hypothetical protein